MASPLDELLGGGGPAPAPTSPAPTTPTSQSLPPIQSENLTARQRALTSAQRHYEEANQQAADATYALDVDVEEGIDPAKVNQLLSGLSRLNYAASQDPDNTELRNFVAYKLKAVVDSGYAPEGSIEQYGLQNIDLPDDPGWFQQAVGAAIEIPVLGDTIEYLTDVSEGFTMAWALGQHDDENRHWEMIDAIVDGLKGKDQRQEFIDMIDQDGDGVINFREVMGKNPNAGEIEDAEGFWEKAWNYGVGAADTLGLIATDPTAYVTLGVGSVSRARLGIRAVEEVAGEAGVALVKRGGIQALDAAQQKGVYNKIVELVSEGAPASRVRLGERVRGMAAGSAEQIERRSLQQAAQMMRYQNFLADAGRAVKFGLPGRRAYGALEQALPQPRLRRATDDIVGPVADPRWVGQQTRRGIRDLTPYQRAASGLDFIRPRAALRRAFGGRVERIIDDIRVEAGSMPDHLLNDMNQRAIGAQRRAVQEMNDRLASKVPGMRRVGAADTLEDVNAIVREALEGGRPPGGMGPQLDAAQQVAKVVDDLNRRGLHRTAEYVETMAAIRETIEDAARRAGLPEEHLNLRYMPRSLTREGQEQIVQNRALAEELGHSPEAVAQREFAFQRPRDPRLAHMTVEEVNDHLKKKFNLPDGVKLFEDDPLAAFAIRGKSAFQAATTIDLLDGLTKQLDSAGNPLAIWDDAAETAADKSARKAQEQARRDAEKAARDALPKGKSKKALQAREDFEKALKDQRKKQKKADKALARSRGRMTRKADSLEYHRVDTPNGIIYMPKEVAKELRQVRDLLLNDEALAKTNEFFENWSKTWGSWATSPLIDGIGFHSRNATGNMMLNAVKGIVNPAVYARAQRVQWKLYRARLAMRRKNLTFEEAMDDVGMSARQKALARQARQYDIMGAAFFDDLALDRDVTGLWKFVGENKLISTGRAFGSAIEHNARMAHYIHMIDEGLAPADAARSVRQTLFDYSDLTSFERRKLRAVSRFYTFMRKNAAYQMWALIHYPGRVAQLEARTEGALDLEEILGLEMAGYAAERGDRFLDPFGLKGATAEIDTPFGAAEEAFRPLLLLGAEAVGAEDVTGQEHAAAWMGLTSGGPRALADLAYKKITGVDPFTGAPARGGNEKFWMEFADVIIGPAWSSFDRMVQRTTRGEGLGPIGNDPTRTSQIGEPGGGLDLFGLYEVPEAVILSNILGLNIAPYGDEQATSNIYAMIEETENLLKKIPGAPTIEQLRRNGILPPPPGSPSIARSVTLQSQIEEDQAIGLDTTELEAEYQQALIDEQERGTIIDEETGEYTTRLNRLSDYSLSASLFVLDDDGNPSLDDDGNPKPSQGKLAKVLYSIDNPGDAFLDDDGTPFDEYDIPVRWYDVSQTEVLEWARRTGAPLSETGNVITATQNAWNQTFPDNPYYGKTNVIDRVLGGLRPIQGIYTWVDDQGQTQEVRGPVSAAEILGTQPQVQSGTGALMPGGDDSPLSALLGG